jgi:hypothetical protein
MRPIKILGHLMEVVFDEKLSIKRGVNGECCCNTGHLRISAQAQFSQQQDTLIHEILEAINYNLELKLEHHQICSIACVLHQVLMDNPDVLNFMKVKAVP